MNEKIEKALDIKTVKDSHGEMRVPSDALYGAVTARALENFKVGEEKMPTEIIRAIALIKKAAAAANAELSLIEKNKAAAISKAADEIIGGDHADDFPVSLWQTGSGTSTNMNVNEVIANLASLHPNDDVNMSQSTNDVFPSAMNISTLMSSKLKLLPAIFALETSFARLAERHASLVKIGRTHLQDAVPLTLGQEFSAYAEMMRKDTEAIVKMSEPLYELAIGGTAVGTGLNADKRFAGLAAKFISKETGLPFRSAENKFHALSSKANFAGFHGALKALAADLMKIANDIRWLASGPRCGLAEISLPENEPGSSIMPGKVNPTQCEMLTMVCAEIMGADVTVGIAASQGNFELNVYMPVIAHNTLRSIRLLADAAYSFNENCVLGITPNIAKIAEYLNKSLMLVTRLSPKIGYDIAAEIAKAAHRNGTTLKEETMARGLLEEGEIDKLLDPRKMV
jgi:fumarate hydratase class II